MLTVLFSTYNGAKALPLTLEAMTRLQAPEGGWRLVVADNGSEDDSAAIIRRYEDRLPLVPVSEPRRGKNRALNTALQHAEGDLYIFTDDDVLPDEDWLVQLRRVADSQPDYAVFGGPILPYWAVDPEDWITRFVPLGITFALTDPDIEEGPVAPALIWGPNMAVRRAVFDAGHRFEESIGPNGTSYAMGSETEFIHRVCQHGFQSWFCRGARVRHFIRAHQMSKQWVMGRAYRAGRGIYRRQLATKANSVPTFFGLPRWALRQVCQNSAEAALATLRGDAGQEFGARWNLNYYRGYLSEAWRARGAAAGE